MHTNRFGRAFVGLAFWFAACAEAPTAPETTLEVPFKAPFETALASEAAKYEEFAASVRQFEAEIALSGASHAWAGVYYSGNGLSENVKLWLAPSGEFKALRGSCLGYGEPNQGKVRERDGQLELSFTSPNRRSEGRGFDETLLVVHWGQRHYLVVPDRMLDFANDFNEGTDVSNINHFVRVGDEFAPTSGKPIVPPAYEPFFLDAPIEGRIVELLGSRTECIKDWEYNVVLVRLDVGTINGAFVDMCLRVTAPHPRHSYRLIEVAECTSIAARSRFSRIEPEVGWTLSTKD